MIDNSTNFDTHIGVGCIIHRANMVLLSRRKNSHGTGTWSFPGGHLEENEHPFDCALRETLEETGLEVCSPEILTWSFDTFAEKQRHYVTLFVKTTYSGGEPRRLEPQTNDEWQWFPQNALPTPLFAPIHSLRFFGYQASNEHSTH